MIWKPLIAATLALWLSMAGAGPELFFTNPSITNTDGLTLIEGSLKEMNLQPRSLGWPVSRATYPSGIAIDRQGNYYFGDVSLNPMRVTLKKLNPRGELTELGTVVDTSAGFVSNGGWGFDLALSGKNELYFNHPSIRDAQGNTLARGYIAKIDLKTGARSTVVPNLDDPSGLALDQLGNLYFGNVIFNPFKVRVYKLGTGGKLKSLGIVVDSTAGGVSLGGWGFDLATGKPNILYFNHPVVKDAQGKVLVAAHIGTIDLDTGVKRRLITRLDHPSGLATDDEGNLYFGNLSYGPVRWDLYKLNAKGGIASLGIGLLASSGSVHFGGWALDLAVNYCKDTDGDALCDDWEEFGYDADGDGVIDVNLPAMGASKFHKDIFVEVDWMVGKRPRQAAIDKVVDAFRNAPVANPDGVQGIALHVDMGQLGGGNEVPLKRNLKPLWTEFDKIKATNFDAGRARIFHYCLFANNYEGTTSSGQSRDIVASDFVVTLGSWDQGVGTLKQQAGTFMHELGHNLGLRHGGTDDEGYKPNFISVMNYLFQTNWIRYEGKNSLLDYSSLDLGPLDERHLDEHSGLVQVTGSRSLYKYGTSWFNAAGELRHTDSVARPIDWSGNGAASQTGVRLDLNGSGRFNVLKGRIVEWEHLVFNGGDVGFGNKVRALADLLAVQPQQELDYPSDQRLQRSQRQGR